MSESTLHIPERTTLLKHELLFKAKLPPLGFNSYVVESISGNFLINKNIIKILVLVISRPKLLS